MIATISASPVSRPNCRAMSTAREMCGPVTERMTTRAATISSTACLGIVSWATSAGWRPNRLAIALYGPPVPCACLDGHDPVDGLAENIGGRETLNVRMFHSIQQLRTCRPVGRVIHDGVD